MHSLLEPTCGVLGVPAGRLHNHWVQDWAMTVAVIVVTRKHLRAGELIWSDQAGVATDNDVFHFLWLLFVSSINYN